MTSGCNNTLFHYIQLDEQEGVFICPTQQELVQIISATHNQLLLNFHTACIAIHQVIGHAARVEVGYLMLKQSTYQLSILRILMVFRNKCLENVRHSTEDLQSWKRFFFIHKIFSCNKICVLITLELLNRSFALPCTGS